MLFQEIAIFSTLVLFIHIDKLSNKSTLHQLNWVEWFGTERRLAVTQKEELNKSRSLLIEYPLWDLDGSIVFLH